MVQKVIFGLWDVFFMKWLHLGRHLRPIVMKDYFSKYLVEDSVTVDLYYIRINYYSNKKEIFKSDNKGFRIPIDC